PTPANPSAAGSRGARTSAARRPSAPARSRGGSPTRRARRRRRAPSRERPPPAPAPPPRRPPGSPLARPPAQGRAHGRAGRPGLLLAQSDLGADLQRPSLEQLLQHAGEVDLLDRLGQLEGESLQELAAGALALLDGEVGPVPGDRLAKGL